VAWRGVAWRCRIVASNPQPVAVAVALEPVADGERWTVDGED